MGAHAISLCEPAIVIHGCNVDFALLCHSSAAGPFKSASTALTQTTWAAFHPIWVQSHVQPAVSIWISGGYCFMHATCLSDPPGGAAQALCVPRGLPSVCQWHVPLTCQDGMLLFGVTQPVFFREERQNTFTLTLYLIDHGSCMATSASNLSHSPSQRLLHCHSMLEAHTGLLPRQHA